MNRILFCMVITGLLFTSIPIKAQGLRVLKGKPNDVRLQPLKDLNGFFGFTPPESIEAWNRRREELRFQVKVALGLEPEPTRTKLNARVYGRVSLDDYVVDKVYFESMPGFYVTGSLYRPKNPSGKMPGVLCPHGHWANGRFYDAGEANAKALVKEGGESNVEAARNHIQARCVHLARMGCVAFQYDMIGYADSVQLNHYLAHGFSRQRPEFNGQNWGLYSPDAERNLQSIMGLQSWNSIRALDFLETVEGVDPERLAVTGASGGGTQTFLLAAIDDRIKVSFPAVMVSTAMQGGCTCENCSLLRVTTGNIELAGLFAPRPMGVTAANDWTKEMRTKGFPELKELYKLLGAEQNLTFVDRTEFGHNYNQISRVAFYEWIKKNFGLTTSTRERPYRRLTKEELTVWDKDHPKPKADPDFERRLLKQWKKDADKKLASLSKDKIKYKHYLQKAFHALLQRKSPRPDDMTFEATLKQDAGSYFLIGGPVRNTKFEEEIPVVFVYPKKWNGKVRLMISDQGKNRLFKDKEKLADDVLELVEQGTSVVAADLLFQGEFNEGAAPKRTRKVKNPREAACYTFGYNHSLFAQRSHDVANLLTLIASHERKPESIEIVASGKTGAIAAAALTITRTKVANLEIEKSAVLALQADDIHSPYFIPGASRFGGVKGMLTASGVNFKIR